MGIAGAMLVGVVGAAMRTSTSAPARAGAAAFAEFFRNTPPLVWVYFFFFALPLIGILLPPIAVGTIALSFYQGAIAIEILRARLSSDAIGLSEMSSGGRGCESPQILVSIASPPR